MMNKKILQGLTTRLDEDKGRWAEELPNVMWAYHTTSYTLINKTPFSLAFGTKAMIPIEIGLPTMWIKYFNELSNSD